MSSRLGPGGLAPLVLLTFVPLARLRREGRLGLNPTSEESSRVLMAYFMLETLREGRVLELKREINALPASEMSASEKREALAELADYEAQLLESLPLREWREQAKLMQF